MTTKRTFLGVDVPKPRVALFELSSCEGCQLQFLNNESSLLDFLSMIEIVTFREGMTEQSNVYDIAFVEGSITRKDEEQRLLTIRKNAAIVVALGSCACFGGVNQLKNRFNDLEWVKKEVYGNVPIETQDAKPLSALIKVDLEIYGCPIKKEELEVIVTSLILGKAINHPKYPVCMECKAKGNICLFDLGEPCLGPITRAGCDAWCPSNRLGCWGCRGPAPGANVDQLVQICTDRGIPMERVMDRLECFGGFSQAVEQCKEGL